MLADDVAVALAPGRTYAQLVERPEPISWWRALERPVLVLLVIGVAGAIATTGRVTAGLVANTMLVWSFAVAVQIAAGAAIIAVTASRRVTVLQAIDLLFAGHLPWSLWVCGVAAWAASDGGHVIEIVAGGAAVAIVWNAIVVSAFIRVVLAARGGGIWARTLAHQGLIWAFGLTYIAWMSGGWFRLLNP